MTKQQNNSTTEQPAESADSRVTTSLPSELHRRVKFQSVVTGLTVQQVVEKAVELYLDREDLAQDIRGGKKPHGKTA